jgi:hypothetical protein
MLVMTWSADGNLAAVNLIESPNSDGSGLGEPLVLRSEILPCLSVRRMDLEGLHYEPAKLRAVWVIASSSNLCRSLSLREAPLRFQHCGRSGEGRRKAKGMNHNGDMLMECQSMHWSPVVLHHQDSIQLLSWNENNCLA